MGNINKIEVQLDKRRHLLLDMAAVARFEYSTGKPFFSMLTWKRLSRKDTVFVLWAALVWEDAGLLPGDVLEMFKNKSIDTKVVIEKLTTSWALMISKLVGGN